MARTALPERPNLFLVRCNLEASTPLHKVAEPAVPTPEQTFQVVKDELLGLIEQAIDRIEQGGEGPAALRELWAVLLKLKTTVARDPGIRMAADDLYAAATMLAAGERLGSAPDPRRWRLLRDADARLRTRLASAQPSDPSGVSGLN